MSWDDEDFEVKEITQDKKDVDLALTEDIEKLKIANVVPSQPKNTNKPTYTTKNLTGKEKRDLERQREKDAQLDREHGDQPMSQAEKQRREELVRRADLENAKDLFGGVDAPPVSKGIQKDVKIIQDFKPTNDAEFAEFAKWIAGHVVKFEAHNSYPNFLKTFLLEATKPMVTDELKPVMDSLNAIYNDKIKQQKSNTKKKAAPKKPTLAKAQKDFDEDEDDDYDDFDDFM